MHIPVIDKRTMDITDNYDYQLIDELLTAIFIRMFVF